MFKRPVWDHKKAFFFHNFDLSWPVMKSPLGPRSDIQWPTFFCQTSLVPLSDKQGKDLHCHIVSARWRTRRHWTLEERHVRQRTAVFQSGDKGISLLLKEIGKWKRRSWSAKGKGLCFVWWHPFRKGPLHRPPFLHLPEAREMSDKEFAQRLRCGSNTVVNSK